jgi:neutral ceramidase
MTLKAGAAVRQINPPSDAVLFGYPHVERKSTGVHDSLLASVIYLEDGSHRVLLIALDLLFLDPPTVRSIRGAVAAETLVPQASVFISCTHTHSGPVSCKLIGWQEDPAVGDPDPGYLQFVREQVIDAAREAAGATRLAELAWTAADATGVGGNRLAAGGITDSEVGILAVRKRSGGDPIAAALVYGMHPTVLHEDSTLVSSDFPHYARRHLQERFGQALTVVYQTAPCGNQSPRRFVTGQTFDEAQRLGRKLGKAAVAAIEQLANDDFARQCRLSGELREVVLPRRTLPSSTEAERRLDESRARYERLKAEDAERATVRTAECAVFGAEGTVVLARANQRGEIDRTLERYRPLEVQLLRIGNAWLAGLPGELFTEYALKIKRRAPEKTFVASLVGGELQGYVVTPEGDAQGGYEAANSLFLPAAGDVMVEVVLSMLSTA